MFIDLLNKVIFWQEQMPSKTCKIKKNVNFEINFILLVKLSAFSSKLSERMSAY